MTKEGKGQNGEQMKTGDEGLGSVFVGRDGGLALGRVTFAGYGLYRNHPSKRRGTKSGNRAASFP